MIANDCIRIYSYKGFNNNKYYSWKSFDNRKKKKELHAE